MRHAAAGRVGHVAVLKMESRARDTVEIPGMVIMEMSHDDVTHTIGVNVEESQRVDRRSEKIAAPAGGGLLVESSVDNVRAIAAAQNPHEIIQVRREFMRVREQKILARMPVAVVPVPDRKNFKRFDFHEGLPRA